MAPILLRGAVVWLALVVLAIFNGGFRAKVLIPRMGEHAGHVISSILLSLIILAVAWLSIGWIHPVAYADAAGVGFLWLGMTLAFEFGAGHYLFKQPWGRLLADYNLAKGRVWMLVLIVTAEAPLLAARGRGLLAP